LEYTDLEWLCCRLDVQVRTLVGELFFFLSKPSRSDLGPKWLCSFSGCKRLGLKLTIHLHLVPKLRLSGVLPQLPYMTSRRPRGQLYIYLSYFIPANLKVKKKINLYTSLQNIKSIFPKLFFPGPLLASKNNDGFSYPCSRKYIMSRW
jgi:hypothetical protein